MHKDFLLCDIIQSAEPLPFKFFMSAKARHTAFIFDTKTCVQKLH